MCGIAGEIRFASGPSEADWDSLSNLMRRRGPDDEGRWDDDNHCTLVFRRLAILDLSPKGHQPMVHASGRYVLVFNGEIYNFKDLRRDLEAAGETFQSTGDTEVLLKALIRWDTAALERLNGIFALALYDVAAKTLLLARDHAGIKPLYVLKDHRGIVFGSQFNQLLKHPWAAAHPVCPRATAMYLQYSYIPAPFAMLDGSIMLRPGEWIRFGADGTEQSGSHWSFPAANKTWLHGTDVEEALDEAIANAVRRQLISDVPVGAFLSGGIDSPLIVAHMRAAGHDSLTTYTIATGETDSDESDDAQRYAAELGVKQIVESISPERALEFLPEVIEASAEPFGDYSIFPTMLVSRLASSDFKVMLSGDGGDELFWGYPDRAAALIENAAAFRTPYPVRRLQALARKAVGRRIPARLGQRSIGSWHELRHTCLKNGWFHRLFPDAGTTSTEFHGYEFSGFDQDQVAEWLRRNEFEYHLAMVLLKVDRASMHCSQEVRVPLLDKEVIETAARIDWQQCLSLETRVGKLPLRKCLRRHVQHQTMQKRGFEAPMAAWLRGPLRDSFERLVLGRDDFFGVRIDKAAMRRIFAEHLAGHADHAFGLWPILSLAMWQEEHLQ